MANVSVNSTSVQSRSANQRSEGNSHYLKARERGLPASVQRERFQRALICYNSALNLSENQDEFASAAKNIAVASWKMGEAVSKGCNKALVGEPMLYYFRDALQHFNKAVTSGAKAKNQVWNDSLMQQVYDCLQGALSSADNLSSTNKERFIDGVCRWIPIDDFKTDWYIELCSMIFHEGIMTFQAGDYKRCLRKMHDCYFPLEEARRYNQGADHLSEINILERDIQTHMCSAEALQARETGDQLLEHILKDEEDINFDMVWEVIDWYKKSILLTREKDVEIECIALSRLGRVYDKVVKDKVRAKENFRRSLDLSQTLFPRTFLADVWYTECVTTLSRYQQEQQNQIDLAKRKEKEGVLDELKPELQELKKNNTSTLALLKYTYLTHPPKNTEHKLVIDDETNLRKVVQKAIFHYHPDRQSEETHGKKWVVLAEEITKLLTCRYECYKDLKILPQKSQLKIKKKQRRNLKTMKQRKQ